MAFDDSIKAGATSKIVEVMLRDSSTGAGKTGVAYTDLTASYTREGGTRTAITLASGTAGDAYSSGKWAEVDATNCKGLYQLHVPDAAIAASAEAVTISLQATGVIDKSVRIKLRATDVQDGTRGGMTALPNAAADAAGGLPTSDAGGLDLDALLGNVAKIDGSTTAATNLKQSCLAIQTITVQTAEAAANTATSFDTDLPLENDNYYGSADGGLVIAFISGAANQFQTRRIVASSTVTANTRITLEEALDATPADGNVAVVLGRITELA